MVLLDLQNLFIVEVPNLASTWRWRIVDVLYLTIFLPGPQYITAVPEYNDIGFFFSRWNQYQSPFWENVWKQLQSFFTCTLLVTATMNDTEEHDELDSDTAAEIFADPTANDSENTLLEDSDYFHPTLAAPDEIFEKDSEVPLISAKDLSNSGTCLPWIYAMLTEALPIARKFLFMTPEFAAQQKKKRDVAAKRKAKVAKEKEQATAERDEDQLAENERLQPSTSPIPTMTTMQPQVQRRTRKQKRKMILQPRQHSMYLSSPLQWHQLDEARRWPCPRSLCVDPSFHPSTLNIRHSRVT